MNRAWSVFYGLKLGMTREETMNTLYGEFLDLINCMDIYNGKKQPKKKKYSFEEIMELR